MNELIKELNDKHINIYFAKGKLKYTGPKEHIDADMLSILKQNKSKLLKHFWPDECINMMPINTEGTLAPLAIVHAGGANYVISDIIGKDRPYYGFFNIGSEGENKRFKDVESFACEYLRQLENIVPELPYYLGGFSFGGHLAYEIAIQLQKKGKQVPLLFLGDPGLPSELKSSVRDRKRQFKRLLKDMYYSLFNVLIKALLAIVSSLYTKIPTSIRRNYIVWTYMTLQKKYRPTEKFFGKIILFRAEENSHESKYLGWEKLCDNIELYTYKGGHGAMYDSSVTIESISHDIKNVITQYEKQS